MRLTAPRGRMVSAGLLTLMLVAVSAGAVVAADSAVGNVTRTRLGNGFTVLVRENPYAPVLAISLQVKMGNRWETRANAGISNLLQLMLVRGTTNLTGPEIVAAADRMGGSIDATGDVDSSEISATALAKNWVQILELVADVALHPSVPQGTFDAVRDFLLRQIRNRGDKPYFVALDTLTAKIYGPNPYAWDSLGLKESLGSIDRDTLLAHYRRFYVPGGMVLAVSGRVKSPEVLAQAERLFGAMPAGSPPVAAPPKPPAPAASREGLIVPGAQAQIVMGRLAPSLTDPDYPAVKVLSSILGGGMAGRFFSDLRDKQALAYTTATQFPSRVDPSYFLALLGTAPANVAKAEAALRDQLERIQREPVSDAELSVGKEYLLGNLEMDRRTNARQAWYLAFYEIAGVGYEFLDRFMARVRQITTADVQQAAQRYLSPLAAVVVEPPAK
ncbi:MAG TPA: pitrilysin family protein [Candidatus Methylomirabilis sp.]|nr:pitrilysin family protein [Candidatus Methylomirabilis sp.]